MQNDKKIGSRLKKALELLKINIAEASKITKIPYPTLQDYLNNKRIPGGSNLKKLSMHLHISADWLLTGEGSMFKQEGEKECLSENDKSMFKTETEIKQLLQEKVIDWVKHFIENASLKELHWFEVQLEKSFPEFKEWVEKNKK